MRSLLFNAIAKRYLGKEDLSAFLSIRFPDFKSMTTGFWNEIAWRVGAHKQVRLSTLNIELTSRCNVSCTYCDVNRNLGRPNTDLEVSVVERLLNETPGIQTLLPFQWGEPLLYPFLDDVLHLASQRKIRSYLTTNGTLLDGTRFENLSRAGLTRLTVSLDGNPKSHLDRRHYAQEPILQRLTEARRAQQHLNLPTAIDVSMVVDSKNEHQIEEFREYLTPICDRVQFIPRLIKGQRQDACREPSRGVIVVLSDGTLTTCCADVGGKLALGHIEAGRLDQQYRSDPWITLREQHTRGDYPKPCASCSECAVPGVSPRFS